MEKFSELQYMRPDFAAFTQRLKAHVAEIGAASSWEELNAALRTHAEDRSQLMTMHTIASVRNTVNMADPFYEEEMKVFHAEMPAINMLERQADAALLASPFVGDFEQTYGSILIQNKRNNQRFADERLIPLQIRESNLQAAYSKCSAMAVTDFHGKKSNFYALLKEMLSTDRENRAEAFKAWADLYAAIAPELDGIFDEMLEVRNEMAAIVDFDSYTDMAYQQRRRFDYDAEDAKRFREQVKAVVTPACQKIFEAQRQRLGVDKLHWYDENMVFPQGNAMPRGTKDELVEKALQMYKELSAETGEFFQFMVDHELFDLESRQGKRPGGYCTTLSSYRAPFIFANFNGTAADIGVLTHEAGHAFEAYVASRCLPLQELTHSTSEINEIHSMSMEHFTYPWMEKFFGEETTEYLYDHLWGALNVIPYMCCVDEFQHCVYAKKLNADQRRACWHELEQQYMPWRAYDGNAFLEHGGFWMQKQHIFLYPFYYIEYALAQMGAFEFYLRMNEDREAAWADYLKLCRAGGSLGYFKLLELAGLSNPFTEGTVAGIVEHIVQDIDALDIKLKAKK